MEPVYEVVSLTGKTIATFVFRQDAEYFVRNSYPLGKIEERTFSRIPTKRKKSESETNHKGTV